MRQGPPSHWVTGWVPDAWCRPIDLDWHLPGELLRAREAAVQRILPALRQRGLSEAQWRVLRALEGGATLSLAETAARAAMGMGDVYRMDALSSRGLVRRAREARIVPGANAPPGLPRLCFALTDSGRDMVWRVRTALRAAFVDIAPRFPPRERARLEQGLAALVRACGAALPPPEPPPAVHATPDDPLGWTAAAAHDLDLGLPLTLYRVRTVLLGRIRPLLMHHYLTEPQWRCLRIFAVYDVSLTRRAVSRAGCFQPGNAYRLIDMLRERGLVQSDLSGRRTIGVRRPRPRKRFKLQITGSGRRLVERIEEDEIRFLADVREQASAGDVAALRRALGRLTGALLAPADADAALPIGHPLDAVYDAEDARNRAAAARANARKREMRTRSRAQESVSR